MVSRAGNSGAAAEELKELRYFEANKVVYAETLKAIERGRPTCTKVLNERGLDLNHLLGVGSSFPPGLPSELQKWLIACIAAGAIQKTLERMGLLLREQEDLAAHNARLPRKVYPILAHAGSVGPEGKLHAPVVKQAFPLDKADILEQDPEIPASQMSSQPETSAAAIASSGPASSEQETAPLIIPKANPSTAGHAADNLRRQGRTLLPWRTEHAVTSEWSGSALGAEVLV